MVCHIKDVLYQALCSFGGEKLASSRGCNVANEESASELLPWLP